MLSFKFFASTVRGASLVSSNQVNSLIAKTSNLREHENLSGSNLYTRGINTTSLGGGLLSQAAKDSIKQNIANLEESIYLPERPKKPATPWLRFVSQRKDDVLRLKNKMTAAELAVILAKEWKQADKSRYQHEYDLEHQEYQRKLEDYEKSLTNEQKQYLKVRQKFKQADKAEKLLRRTKPPVLPRNPANLYCHERSKHADVQEQLKYRKPSEVFSDIFKEYRSLPEYEKKKYLEMQQNDKLRFQHEFMAWYESIQTNEAMTKVALEKVDALRNRYKSLKYI